MSIVSIIYLPEGIIMAADSRLTRNLSFTNQDQKTVEKFTSSDNAQKIMLLNKCPVGIAYVGNAIINGQTIADYVRLFEIACVQPTDTAQTVANKLAQRKNEFEGTTFFVCGYNNDVPYVFEVNSDNVKRMNVNSAGNVIYSFMWAGEKTAISRLVNTEPPMNTNEKLMPLKDGIDFAEFLVDLTIKYQRFSDNLKTCGGPIDILVLTKDTPFWYKHKLFKC